MTNKCKVCGITKGAVYYAVPEDRWLCLPCARWALKVIQELFERSFKNILKGVENE
jgi:hypothetical protein